MVTVKKLIEMLATYNADSIIKWHDGSDISHINGLEGMVIISDHKYIGICSHCDNGVYKENVLKDYTAYCPSCDENLFSGEILNY